MIVPESYWPRSHLYVFIAQTSIKWIGHILMPYTDRGGQDVAKLGRRRVGWGVGRVSLGEGKYGNRSCHRILISLLGLKVLHGATWVWTSDFTGWDASRLIAATGDWHRIREQMFPYLEETSNCLSACAGYNGSSLIATISWCRSNWAARQVPAGDAGNWESGTFYMKQLSSTELRHHPLL